MTMAAVMLQRTTELLVAQRMHILTDEQWSADPGRVLELGKDRGSCLASEHHSELATGHPATATTAILH